MKTLLNFPKAAAALILLSFFCGCSGAPDDKKISSIISGFKWHGLYTFSMDLGGLKAYFDPSPREYVKRLGKDDFYTAGIIFISHDISHLGTLDVKSQIDILTNGSTLIVMPSQEALYLTNVHPGYKAYGFLPGESGRIGGLFIETVPAYDIILQHIAVVDRMKAYNWLGYIITIDGVRIYYTGASQLIPEMKNIHCDILIASIYLKPADISGLVTLAEWTGAKAVIPVGYAPGGVFTEQLEEAQKALYGRCRIMVQEIE